MRRVLGVTGVARFHGLRSYRRTIEKAGEHADKQKDQA
jgi:hypothetical protein